MRRTVSSLPLWSFLVATFVLPITVASSQQIDLDAVRSRDEFRWGLSAYHNALYGEAVLAFERALGFKPDDLRTTEWLGAAYYRLGFEDTALTLWDRVLDERAASATLVFRIETINYRRGVMRELSGSDRYVETYSLRGDQGEFELFLRPASVLPASDGGFYVTSFAGNQVIKFDANAAVDRKFLGGLSGLDHPFDVTETTNGYVFISEFLRNGIYRSDLRGQSPLRFGSRGTKEGELLGPQYLAVDPAGYLYVSEAGNRRVSKFDFDGRVLLTFGRPVENFPGFLNPTGVAVIDGRVFVCDQRRGSIYAFDSSGNYLGAIAEGIFESPEGITPVGTNRLLVADTTSLKWYDIERRTVTAVTDGSIVFKKLTKAAIDVNGHVLAADFTANSISVLTGISSLYTGLLVEVVRIDPRDFPRIVVEVSVETRDGAPVIGLDESNFLFTERSGSVDTPIMLAPEPGLDGRLAVIVEQSAAFEASRATVSASVGTLYDAMQGVGGISVYLAGAIPTFVGDSTGAKSAILDRIVSAGGSGSSWRLDAAVRLGGAELTGFPGAREVVLVTSGKLGSGAFDEYPPDVLASYLRNNDISFSCVFLTPSPEDREVFEYLCTETGGESYYLYRPAGIGEIATRVLEQKTGRYYFQYDSTSRTDFGDAYIPVEVEVQFYRRSGRGSSAYFPPVEY